MKPIEFERSLVDGGGTVVHSAGPDGVGFGCDDNYNYRWEFDKVEVGIKATFDRWANSRDYVLYRRITRVDLDVLRATCLAAQAAGRRGDCGDPYDIAGEYRKQRRIKR